MKTGETRDLITNPKDPRLLKKLKTMRALCREFFSGLDGMDDEALMVIFLSCHHVVSMKSKSQSACSRDVFEEFMRVALKGFLKALDDNIKRGASNDK